MIGAYALFDPKLIKETFHVGGYDYENQELTYKQMRLPLTLIQRIGILFAYRPVKTYSEANKCLLDVGYESQ